MPDPVCKQITVRKTKDMSLRKGTEGWVLLLAEAIRHVLPQASFDDRRNAAALLVDAYVHPAMETLDRSTIEPRIMTTLEMIMKFDAALPDTDFGFNVCLSFLEDLDTLLRVPQDLILTCRGLKDAPSKRDTPCRIPYLENLTPDERFAWATKTILRERKTAGEREEKGLLRLNRYEPGRVYGNVIFVYHPFNIPDAGLGFPDVQVWMDGQDNLYWLDERDCRLEAFRKGVVAAGGSVFMAWVVTAFSTAVMLAGPYLASALPRAGYALWNWLLGDPINSGAVLWSGAELVLSVAFGADFGPVSPYDQLEFVASRPTRRQVRRIAGGAVKYLARVTDVVVESGAVRKIKAKVVAADAIDGATVQAFWQRAGKPIVRVLAKSVPDTTIAKKVISDTAVAPDLLVRLRELLLRSYRRMGRQRNAAVQRIMDAVQTSTDPVLIGFLNQFIDGSNVERVVKQYMAGGNDRVGAEYLMRFARAQYPDGLSGRAFAFELTVGPKGAQRRIDLWVEGICYELKSDRPRASFGRPRVAVRPGGRRMPVLAELQKDLIHVLGANAETALDNLKKVRWVFNPAKTGGLTEAQIEEKLLGWVRESGLFRDYPRWGEIEEGVRGFVVLFP